MSLKELGLTDLVQMKIEEKPGSRPVQYKPYHASQVEREEMRRIVQGMKEAGICRETNSAYASPAFLVKKKNGESRLVIDYWRLNAKTERIHFPLPDIDDHLEQIGQSVVHNARFNARLLANPSRRGITSENGVYYA